MISRTKDFVKDIRTMPLFQQVIPMEAAVGWPIPKRKAGKLYVKFPFFGQVKMTTEEKARFNLFPPFAMMTFDWQTLGLVEYIDFRFSNPDPELQWEGKAPIGIFPHPAIAKQMSIENYIQKRHELYAMYDRLFNVLENGSSQSPEEDSAFSHLFSLLLEPPLLPYYRALGGRFLEHFWVESS